MESEVCRHADGLAPERRWIATSMSCRWPFLEFGYSRRHSSAFWKGGPGKTFTCAANRRDGNTQRRTSRAAS
jgi:hypothetical protein